jgi:hypothetical protein
MSKKYPFVEWGILLSATQEGSPRFPSRSWLRRFSDMVLDHNERRDPHIHVSAHLCGRWLRDLLKGNNSCPHLDLGIFERVQLNFHGERQEVRMTEFVDELQKMEADGMKVIFQWDGVNTRILRDAIAAGVDGQALFDLSHGAGILPNTWPYPLDGIYCGYAGGLGPDNLYEQMAMVNTAARDKPYWIDMETGVRSHCGETFDIQKASECLNLASRYITYRIDTRHGSP